MNHLVYLSTNGWVCEKPDLLGHDFLVVDYSGERMCRICTQLVVAYNAKIDNYELTLATVPAEKKSLAQEEPALGFLMGVLCTSAFWITFFLGIWFLFLK